MSQLQKKPNLKGSSQDSSTEDPTHSQLMEAWRFQQEHESKHNSASTPSQGATAKVAGRGRSVTKRPATAGGGESLLPNKAAKTPALRSLPSTVNCSKDSKFTDRWTFLSLEAKHPHYLDITTLAEGTGKRLAMACAIPQTLCSHIVISNVSSGLDSRGIMELVTKLSPFLPSGGQLIDFTSLPATLSRRALSLNTLADDTWPMTFLCLPLTLSAVTAVPSARREVPHLLPQVVYTPAESRPTGPSSEHVIQYVSRLQSSKLLRDSCVPVGVARYYAWAATEVALASQHIQGVLQSRIKSIYAGIWVFVLPGFIRHTVELKHPACLEIVYYVYVQAGDRPVPPDLVSSLLPLAGGTATVPQAGTLFEVPGPFMLYPSAQCIINLPYDPRQSPAPTGIPTGVGGAPAASASSWPACTGLAGYGCLTLLTAPLLHSSTFAQSLSFLTGLLDTDMAGEEDPWVVHRVIKLDSSVAPNQDIVATGLLIMSDLPIPPTLLSQLASAIPDLKSQVIPVSPLDCHRLELMERLARVTEIWRQPPSPSSTPRGEVGPASSSGPAPLPPGLSGVFADITSIRQQQDSAAAVVRSLETSLSSLDKRVNRLALAQSDLRDPDVAHPWSPEVDQLKAEVQELWDYRPWSTDMTSLRENVDNLVGEVKLLRDSTKRLWAAVMAGTDSRLGSSAATANGTTLTPGLTLPSFPGTIPPFSVEITSSVEELSLSADTPAQGTRSPPSVELAQDLLGAAEGSTLFQEEDAAAARLSSMLSSWPTDLPPDFSPQFLDLEGSLIMLGRPVTRFPMPTCSPWLSAGPDMPAEQNSPLFWRIAGLDAQLGWGVSIHFPVTNEIRSWVDKGSSEEFGLNFSSCLQCGARVAFYVHASQITREISDSLTPVLWEPTYTPGWFRCKSSSFTDIFGKHGELRGTIRGSTVVFTPPLRNTLHQLVVTTYQALRDPLLLAITHATPRGDDLVRVDAGREGNFVIEMNTQLLANLLGERPFSGDRVWECCCNAKCTFTAPAPDGPLFHKYNRFNILHAVVEVRHKRAQREGDPPFVFNPDNTTHKRAKKHRDEFTAALLPIPPACQDKWNSFLDFLGDGSTRKAQGGSPLTDTELLDTLQEWGWEIPYMRRLSTTSVAHLISLGKDGYVTFGGVLELANKEILCIVHSPPSDNYPDHSYGAEPTAVITTLSLEVRTVRVALQSALAARIADFPRLLAPHLRQYATLGPIPSTSHINE